MIVEIIDTLILNRVLGKLTLDSFNQKLFEP